MVRRDLGWSGRDVFITNLARVYALVAGVAHNQTRERLRERRGRRRDRGRDTRRPDRSAPAAWRIRLERHSELTARGEPPGDLGGPVQTPARHRARARWLASGDRRGTRVLARRLGLRYQR
ncbi:MAG: putative nucleotidyltransferase substrate binding domain-containing protein [Actinomycetota bacterium]